MGELKDKVPNIRLVALKVIKTIFSNLDDNHKQASKNTAQSMTNDPDVDVRSLSQAIYAL